MVGICKASISANQGILKWSLIWKNKCGSQIKTFVTQYIIDFSAGVQIIAQQSGYWSRCADICSMSRFPHVPHSHLLTSLAKSAQVTWTWFLREGVCEHDWFLSMSGLAIHSSNIWILWGNSVACYNILQIPITTCYHFIHLYNFPLFSYRITTY